MSKSLNEETKIKKKEKFNWWELFKLLPSYLTVIVAALGIWWGVENVTKNINKQTQVVIEPREGDIIVKDGDDYKLLQLISEEDVLFPTKIQEIQYQKDESDKDKRVDILNQNNEDWDSRDSFRYVINNFSINPNKVINLLSNIEEIVVYCDFYTEKNISTYVDLDEKDEFKFNMKTATEEKEDFSITKTNISSDKEYVTKELNDGIEWVKIRVQIKYKIGERNIIDTITSDWIETDSDVF